MKTKLFITGLALLAITAFTNAQNTEKGKGEGKGNNSAFVDANNNGVCDNYENRQGNANAKKGNAYKKGNKNGKGNRQGKGQGKGQGFIDENNNGICDRRE